MAHSASRISISRLVIAPTLITLGVTLLRLVGELRGWPSPWFAKNNAIVGITWLLPPTFGVYFAWQLWREGEPIDRIDRAFLFGLLGVALNQLVEATVFQYADISIYSMLVILWTVAVISAYMQYLAWPALCKTLIADQTASSVSPCTAPVRYSWPRTWAPPRESGGRPLRFGQTWRAGL
jgi:hypothetical protein